MDSKITHELYKAPPGVNAIRILFKDKNYSAKTGRN